MENHQACVFSSTPTGASGLLASRKRYSFSRYFFLLSFACPRKRRSLEAASPVTFFSRFYPQMYFLTRSPLFSSSLFLPPLPLPVLPPSPRIGSLASSGRHNGQLILLRKTRTRRCKRVEWKEQVVTRNPRLVSPLFSSTIRRIENRFARFRSRLNGFE